MNEPAGISEMNGRSITVLQRHARLRRRHRILECEGYLAGLLGLLEARDRHPLRKNYF
jgi:hypothetical protein